MLRRVVKRAPKDVLFVVIYTREPHARQMAFKKIVQPTTWKERRDLAKRTKKEMRLDVLFLVDGMGDPSRKLFGDVPNPAIFVEKGGKVAEKLSWADASEVQRVLKTWVPVRKKKAPALPEKKPATPPANKDASKSGGVS